MIEWHNHHLVPTYDGGTDHPDNIVKVNVAMHAMLHKIRFEELGQIEDFRAWTMLEGRKNNMKKIRDAQKLSGHHPNSIDALEKHRYDRTGSTQTAKQKAAASKIWKGKKMYELTCPCCGKTGNGPAMKRWHFDNCKDGGLVN